MITDQMTKTQFIVEVLNRDIKNIYRAQLLIAEKNIRLQGSGFKEKKRAGATIGKRTGYLLKSLQHPRFTISGNDGKFNAQAYVSLQTRFLDMKKHGNWMIYNRQVYGILYRNTQIDIKYRYGDQIRDLLGGSLDSAFKKNNLTTSNF